MVPFTRAAREHREQFYDFTTAALSAQSTQIGPIDVAAYGYLRGIWVTIDASGGTGTGAVAAADGPWSVIQQIQLMDVNGAPLCGPLSGHDLFLANKYGGYKWSPDPRQSPYYSAVAGTGGGFSFALYIPVEISRRDALGALPNQNAASSFKIVLTIAPSTSVYSTPPATTLPSVRVRLQLDAWSQPPGTDLRGNANAMVPPAVGTTQYWSKTSFNLASGQQNVKLPRVGNYLRELIFIARDTANGTRATGLTNFPDPVTVYLDTRPLKTTPKALWDQDMQHKYGFTAAKEAAGGLDTGVYVYDFISDFTGHAGEEMRDDWLGTVQSSRLEIFGNFAAATTLTVLTNDVSPAGEVFV